MASLCIHSAILVDSNGITAGGIVAEDGRITAVLPSIDRAAADVVVDARSRLLFPGFVDAHVHMRDPGQPLKEDFGSGSTAAAIGGITTVMCMPNTRPPIDSIAAVKQAKEAGEGRSFVDFALQAAVHPGNQAALGALWDAGVVSFETMLADGPPGEAYVDDAVLLDMLARVTALDALVGVYAGNQAVVDVAVARLRASGRREFPAFAESRPATSEALGLAVLLEARQATGARLIARQVSTVRGFALAAVAKLRSGMVASALKSRRIICILTSRRWRGWERTRRCFHRCERSPISRLRSRPWLPGLSISSAPITRPTRSPRRPQRTPGPARAERRGSIRSQRPRLTSRRAA